METRTSDKPSRRARPGPSEAAVAFVLGISASMIACEDSPSTRTVQATERAEDPIEHVGAYGPDFCREQADGEACGIDRHCIDERCLFNTCGDAITTGGEQCDDGNELHGDGCTPSCEVELATCGDEREPMAGGDCDAGQTDTSDAGPEPPVPEDCPLAVQLLVGRPLTARVGETITVRAITTGGELLWISTRLAGSEPESSAPFASPNDPETRFSCPEVGEYALTYVVWKRHCPLSSRREVIVQCAAPDAEPPDPS